MDDIKRPRGPYKKDSRTTNWRKKRRLNLNSDCACEYHYDSSLCEHHQPTSPSTCSCEFHACGSNSSELSDSSESHSDSDWLYNSSNSQELDTSDQSKDNALHGLAANEENEPKYAELDPYSVNSPFSLRINFSPDCENKEENHTKSSHQGSSISDDEVSELNCNDLRTCRLDHRPNEDSYRENEENSESSENDLSSSDESSDGESDVENRDGDPEGGDPGGDDPGGDDPGGDDDVDANVSNVNEILDVNNFSLDHPSLNRVLEAANGRTAKEVIAMLLTLTVNQHLNYVTIVQLCRIINVFNAYKALPSTKKQLWAVLQKESAGIVKYAYCEQCSSVLGELKNLPRVVECNNEFCDYRSPRRNVKYFITLSLKKQLKSLLAIPGIRQQLQYKNTRRKLNQEAREDVLDGDGYKALEDMENGLQELDLTCELNTDGFSTSKSSKSQGWAILGRINELPPNLRQKLTFLAGLVIADGEPDMTMLFQPLVDELNEISRNGVEWEENGQVLRSRMFPTCFCVDARARAILLNLNLYNGHYSCPFCLHRGVKLAGSMRFPLPGTEVVLVRHGVEEVLLVPDAPLRTDAGIRDDMQHAHVNQKVHGFHGASVLYNLEKFNFAIGCSTDDLHPIFLGVSKFVTNLIIDAAPNKKEFQEQIDGRLLGILTPTLISRKPRSISRRGKYKGTEWRNWLLYFGVPCMTGLVSNANLRMFSLLSKGVFLLSRDSVTDNDIDVAQRCLLRFVTAFQDMHGPEKMRFNIHIMTHLGEAVRNWGPLHLHSTFPFESWNGRLRKNISSPHGAAEQIVDRYLLESLVRKLPFDLELDEEVRQELNTMSSPYVMENPLKIGDVYFFGKSAPPRPPTDDEVLALNNENLNCDRLTEYYQCRTSRMLLHSTHWLSDSEAYYATGVLKKFNFYVVESIMIFEEDGEQKCGLFCHLLETGNGLNEATHIREVQNEDNAIQWISFDKVRIFAIKMQILNTLYVVPMSNMGEID
ncbi:Halomucin [Frankliniella fusca]|uniref:Halomucin n=1 Tax=Frankliniella fusca TaxID=407009 RepID=A0AAE1I533_9NEOP|nr:Halomucin [Frankliniella fusca]